MDVDDGRLPEPADGGELLLEQEFGRGDHRPAAPDLPARPAQLAQRRAQRIHPAILEDAGARPGGEAVEQVVAPEIASPAPPVTLAQNKPRPRHAAQGRTGKSSPPIIRRWPGRAAELQRQACGALASAAIRRRPPVLGSRAHGNHR